MIDWSKVKGANLIKVTERKPRTFTEGWKSLSNLTETEIDQLEERALATWQECEDLDRSLRELAGQSLAQPMYFG